MNECVAPDSNKTLAQELKTINLSSRTELEIGFLVEKYRILDLLWSFSVSYLYNQHYCPATSLILGFTKLLRRRIINRSICYRVEAERAHFCYGISQNCLACETKQQNGTNVVVYTDSILIQMGNSSTYDLSVTRITSFEVNTTLP